jgi:vancomycin resistance protein YoaR
VAVQADKLGLDPVHRGLDLYKASRALAKVAARIDDPGKSARLRFTSSGLVATRSHNARKMDSKAALQGLLAYTNSAYPPASIDLKVEEKRPKVTTEELQRIKGPIAEFVTRYNPGDRPRTRNVQLVTENLNGALIPIGGVFSFNDRVGSRDVSKGYQVAHVFVRGRMVRDVGGGTCQVSTTLYNAALLGGLPIVERYNHSLTVPYITPGRDATVYFGSRDFRFKNNTNAPIYVRATASGGGMRIVLYGGEKPDTRVQIVSWSRRRWDRVYAGATRLFKRGDVVVRREPLSSDVYKPLELAQQG